MKDEEAEEEGQAWGGTDIENAASFLPLFCVRNDLR